MKAAFLLVDQLLHIGRFLTRVRDRRRRELHKQLVDRGDVVRRLVFKLIGGVAGVTEKCRAFGAQLDHAQDDSTIVPLAAVTVAGERSFHDPFAQRAIFQIGQGRLLARVL